VATCVGVGAEEGLWGRAQFHRLDVGNFDRSFTSEAPVLTPVAAMLTAADQDDFEGFDYTAPWAEGAGAGRPAAISDAPAVPVSSPPPPTVPASAAAAGTALVPTLGTPPPPSGKARTKASPGLTLTVSADTAASPYARGGDSGA
jgi:hypothetical protein